MPEFGVHVIRKINRRGAHRQINHLALRREHVNAVVEQTGFELFGQRTDFTDVANPFPHLVFPVEHLPQPGDFFVITLVLPSAFFVAPMRRDTQLGAVMHLVRADLHFDRFTLGADHRRVQRAIVIALGLGDVIVELLRDRRPQVVHHPQHGVTILHVIDQHAHRAHVI